MDLAGFDCVTACIAPPPPTHTQHNPLIAMGWGSTIYHSVGRWCNPFAKWCGAETRGCNSILETSVWSPRVAGLPTAVTPCKHPILCYQYLLKFLTKPRRSLMMCTPSWSHAYVSRKQWNVDHRVGVQRPGAWEVWTPRSTECVGHGLVDPQSM